MQIECFIALVVGSVIGGALAAVVVALMGWDAKLR